MLSCPRCGQENPEGARFCNACATPLAEAGAARRERRLATALFADLVGSTTLAEQHDAEVVESVVGRTFELLAEEIKRHGGFLEKFMGDAVLAVFGIPTVHEDDPERAVQAALRMQDALPDLKRRLAAEGKPQLAVRIGIESGEVLVDLDRVAGPRDRMLTGDAVNTAARLQQAAKPGGIVVGPNVHAATREIVDYEALPPLILKGKAEPVPAWKPKRVRAERPVVRAPLGLEARLVGRDEELAALQQAFHRVESKRHAGLVTVIGAAGVGKSRLALELTRYLEGLPDDISWRNGRCLTYGNVSYSALAEAVKAQCRILEDDPPDLVAEKAAEAVESLFGDRDLAPQVETLVGSTRRHRFSREQLFAAWRQFLERAAESSPLVLTLEDIHWADDGLLDFIEYLADRARGPLLLITLARPELLERRPGWGGGRPNYSAVHLQPLTREETEAMVQDLLPARLPEELTKLVVERSEGNPLFGEEIVRMFIDRGVLRPVEAGGRWEVASIPEIEIPHSVQALIAARLDALPVQEKAVLQDAAVVGRAFWSGATAQLGGLPAPELEGLLSRLQQRELVHVREPSTFAGQAEFAFRHVLIRDVAYESLPKSQRADKHVEVARWAQEHAGRREEELAELLATHYVQAVGYLNELGEQNGRRAGIESAAFRWAQAAGDRALRLWQQREAVRWFRAALEVASRVGAGRASASLWESYADACQGVEPYSEVEAALDQARALYEQHGSAADLGRVEARLAFVAYQSGQEEAVVERAERALARLEPLGESADLALALSILGQYHRRRGQWEQAEQHLRHAMEMAERVGDPLTQGRAMVWLGSVLQAAEGESGISHLRDALRFARKIGDLSLVLRALLELSEAYEQATGEYREAEALLREGIELARNAGNVGEAAWMEGNLADYLLDLGRLDAEVETLARNGLHAAREVGETTRIGYSLSALALIQLQRGELDEAERALEELSDVIAGCPDPYMEGWHGLAAGLLTRARGKEADAAEILAATARTLGDRIQVWGGQNLLFEAIRCLVRAGRAAEAPDLADRLRTMSERSVPAAAFRSWADGLLAADAGERCVLLAEAADRFDALGRRIEVGRSLIDLAAARRSLGEDPAPALARAREILQNCGARLFLADLEATQASEPPLRSA